MSDKETLTFISTGSNQMIVANWDWVQRTFPADQAPAESTRSADPTTSTETKATKEIKEKKVSGAPQATPATAPKEANEAQDATAGPKTTLPTSAPTHGANEAHPILDAPEAHEETKATVVTKAVDVNEPAMEAPVEVSATNPAYAAISADPANEANPANPANEGSAAKAAPAHTATRAQNPEVTEPLHTDAPVTESHSEPEPESTREPLRETVNPMPSTDSVPPSDVMTATHDASATSERMALTVDNDGESFFATPLADAAPVKHAGFKSRLDKMIRSVKALLDPHGDEEAEKSGKTTKATKPTKAQKAKKAEPPVKDPEDAKDTETAKGKAATPSSRKANTAKEDAPHNANEAKAANVATVTPTETDAVRDPSENPTTDTNAASDVLTEATPPATSKRTTRERSTTGKRRKTKRVKHPATEGTPSAATDTPVAGEAHDALSTPSTVVAQEENAPTSHDVEGEPSDMPDMPQTPQTPASAHEERVTVESPTPLPTETIVASDTEVFNGGELFAAEEDEEEEVAVVVDETSDPATTTATTATTATTSATTSATTPAPQSSRKKKKKARLSRNAFPLGSQTGIAALLKGEGLSFGDVDVRPASLQKETGNDGNPTTTPHASQVTETVSESNDARSTTAMSADSVATRHRVTAPENGEPITIGGAWIPASPVTPQPKKKAKTEKKPTQGPKGPLGPMVPVGEPSPAPLTEGVTETSHTAPKAVVREPANRDTTDNPSTSPITSATNATRMANPQTPVTGTANPAPRVHVARATAGSPLTLNVEGFPVAIAAWDVSWDNPMPSVRHERWQSRKEAQRLGGRPVNMASVAHTWRTALQTGHLAENPGTPSATPSDVSDPTTQRATTPGGSMATPTMAALRVTLSSPTAVHKAEDKSEDTATDEETLVANDARFAEPTDDTPVDDTSSADVEDDGALTHANDATPSSEPPFELPSEPRFGAAGRSGAGEGYYAPECFIDLNTPTPCRLVTPIGEFLLMSEHDIAFENEQREEMLELFGANAWGLPEALRHEMGYTTIDLPERLPWECFEPVYRLWVLTRGMTLGNDPLPTSFCATEEDLREAWRTVALNLAQHERRQAVNALTGIFREEGSDTLRVANRLEDARVATPTLTFASWVEALSDTERASLTNAPHHPHQATHCATHCARTATEGSLNAFDEEAPNAHEGALPALLRPVAPASRGRSTSDRASGALTTSTHESQALSSAALPVMLPLGHLVRASWDASKAWVKSSQPALRLLLQVVFTATTLCLWRLWRTLRFLVLWTWASRFHQMVMVTLLAILLLIVYRTDEIVDVAPNANLMGLDVQTLRTLPPNTVFTVDVSRVNEAFLWASVAEYAGVDSHRLLPDFTHTNRQETHYYQAYAYAIGHRSPLPALRQPDVGDLMVKALTIEKSLIERPITVRVKGIKTTIPATQNGVLTDVVDLTPRLLWRCGLLYVSPEAIEKALYATTHPETDTLADLAVGKALWEDVWAHVSTNTLMPTTKAERTVLTTIFDRVEKAWRDAWNTVKAFLGFTPSVVNDPTTLNPTTAVPMPEAVPLHSGNASPRGTEPTAHGVTPRERTPLSLTSDLGERSTATPMTSPTPADPVPPGQNTTPAGTPALFASERLRATKTDRPDTARVTANEESLDKTRGERSHPEHSDPREFTDLTARAFAPTHLEWVKGSDTAKRHGTLRNDTTRHP